MKVKVKWWQVPALGGAWPLIAVAAVLVWVSRQINVGKDYDETSTN